MSSSYKLPSIDELIKAGHVINLNGSNFVKYSGLVAMAHMKGINRIKTEILIQDVTSEDRITEEKSEEETVKVIKKTIKTARVMIRATVYGQAGEEFTSLGTATQFNLKKNMLPFMFEMAETRAKARALRDFVGIGLTAWEEMPDFEPDRPK